MEDLHAILDFWFGGQDQSALSTPSTAWFQKNPAFDEQIRQRFLGLWQAAQAGQLTPDSANLHQALAWLILTDQFPRNLFRDSPQAFATDAIALAFARQVVQNPAHQQLPNTARSFLYLPFEHSEALADQDEAVRWFETMADDLSMAETIRYAHLHRDVIQQYGRFPHRNAALGRVNTPAEQAYLAQPGAGF